MDKEKDNLAYAKDFMCSKEYCTNQAVAFWPMFDPDIPHYPYCRTCLDDAQTNLIIKIQEGWNKERDK